MAAIETGTCSNSAIFITLLTSFAVNSKPLQKLTFEQSMGFNVVRWQTKELLKMSLAELIVMGDSGKLRYKLETKELKTEDHAKNSM